MNGGLFLERDDGKLLEMTESPYDSEDILQALLAKYPNLLAGDQIDNNAPRRWLLIDREVGVPDTEISGDRWSIDHLFLDQDGIPTLVEVKRSSDTRLRREVIGQMLDYAANVVSYWSVETIINNLENRCINEEKNLEKELSEFLNEAKDADDYWEDVKSNLQTGKIRLLFVADVIPSELRRVIEFLNQQMIRAEVLGIEIKRYSGNDLQTYVPRVFGQSEQIKASKTRSKRKWDEPSFLAELTKKFGSSAKDVALNILDWSKNNASFIDWGQGMQMGSFTPKLTRKNQDISIITVYTQGSIEIKFKTYAATIFKENSKTKCEELLQKLNELDSVDLPRDSINKWASIRISVLENQENFERFIQSLAWLIAEIKRN